jgi:CheY-like chemotaxis protein
MRCPACSHENPDDAAFCGGCGAKQSETSCASCGLRNGPAGKFCHGCGVGLARTEADNSSAASLLDSRLTEIEEELAGMRRDMRGLLNLKEQLQRALDGLRQQRASAAPLPEQPSSLPPGSRRNEALGPRPVIVAQSTAGVPSAAAAKALPAAKSADGVTVVHLEHRLALQAALRTAVEKYGSARYNVAGDARDGARPSRPLLAVNLLLEGRDPLLAVQSASEWGLETPWAFTYCADETRGIVLGMVDFFPPPFEPDDCVTRLLERRGAAQKLLIVSDAVDATSELRSILSRLGCATSVAFDARQALGLVPMVNPDIILVDLNLPKGEALRVIGRVRADPANRDVVFALMWQTAIDHGEFRQQAARIVRDFPFSGDDLRRGISRELSPGGVGFLGSPLKVA